MVQPEVEFSVLTLFPQPSFADLSSHLMAQDVIFVEGGSVLNLMAVWRAHGLPNILRECWESGVVLTGGSAGSICWHRGGPTDSRSDGLDPFTDGIGLLPYSNGVHDDLPDQPRRETYRRMVATGTLDPGYATEDGVGLHYVGTELVEAVSIRDGKKAWHVAADGRGGSTASAIEPRPIQQDGLGATKSRSIRHRTGRTPTAMCLCFLIRIGSHGVREVLLGRKKAGFGRGKIVGLGGHVDPGEDSRSAAIREVWEEAAVAIKPDNIRLAGQVRFWFPAREAWNQVVDIFTADEWCGEVADSDEITPEWHSTPSLPFSAMWDDARYWIPQVMAGASVDATFTFASDCQTVAHAEVRVIRPAEETN